MAFYLMQHGKNLPKESDPEKGLSPRGIEDVKRIAEVAKGYNIMVSEIWHSGKKRARQTADIVQEILAPPMDSKSVDGMGPLDDVVAFSNKIDFKENTLVVGHLPFLEKLISYLITGTTENQLFQLQNGGILCLNYYRSSDKPSIHWGLMPHVA